MHNFVAPNMTQTGDIRKEGVVIQTDAADATAEFGNAFLWFVIIATIVLQKCACLRNLRLNTLFETQLLPSLST